MNAEMKTDFLRFVEECGEMAGRVFRISEAISSNGPTFNRHWTTHTELVLTLATSNWRISGGRLMLAGPTAHYEISADQLTTFHKRGAAEYELVEQYAPTVFRKTTLVVLP
jgi:hypothetical protein